MHRADDWQPSSLPVFVVEDSFYRSRIPPRPVHWSIAWSDLMMTMFILFVTLFAHYGSHQEIVAYGRPGKIADETIPVQADDSQSTLVFHPISQEVTRRTTQSMEKISLPSRGHTGADILIRHMAVEERPQSELQTAAFDFHQEQQAATITPPQPEPVKTGQETAPQAQAQAQAQEQGKSQPQEQGKREELIAGMYDLSKVTLANEKLERFASVEMVPDKAVRIVLTSDLLFSSGQAELTPNAIDSLKKLSPLLKKTPYMINVIGHTDSQPVRAAKFPSNWELSLARASRVARFLIDDTKMPSTQFSVSGYSSFRPLKPNTSEENRKANRRVEIIISKELPQAEAATPANLQ